MISELQGVADWQLQGVIAEGESACVYRAVRAAAGDSEPMRALKLLHATAEDEDLAEAVEAFKQRSEAARSLGHANIVATVDLGEVDGRPYLVMEHVEGVSLDSFPVKRTGRLKPEPAMVVMADLLEALGAALDQGLVHGRLDAGDLLFDEEGQLALTGFGEEDSGQADFLVLAALARELCAAWPAAVEDWIDSLEDGSSTFANPTEALDAFPFSAFSRDAMEQGRKNLARAVKRTLTKRAASELQDSEGAADAPSGDVSAEIAFDPDSESVARDDRFSVMTQRIIASRDAQDPAVLGSALNQATRVAWLCAALLVVGVVIEVVRFSG